MWASKTGATNMDGTPTIRGGGATAGHAPDYSARS